VSLSKALQEEVEAKSRKCLVCDWLNELPQNDQESFTAWANSGRPLAPLFRAAKKQEPPIPVERSAFERHCRSHI
jgi:hypothetical protein